MVLVKEHIHAFVLKKSHDSIDFFVRFVYTIIGRNKRRFIYLTHKCTHSDKESRAKLNQLFTIIGMLDSVADDVFHAISSDVSDFEDAVIIETAIRSRVDCIVTRNTKDYRKSPIPVYTPAQLLELLEKAA